MNKEFYSALCVFVGDGVFEEEELSGFANFFRISSGRNAATRCAFLNTFTTPAARRSLSHCRAEEGFQIAAGGV